MKIATLNTWGHDGPYTERWEILLEELERLNPDVLCLQEVFEPTLPERIQKELHFPCAAASYEAGLVSLSRCPMLGQKNFKYETISPIEIYDRRFTVATLEVGKEILNVVNTHLAWKPEDESTRHGQVRQLLRVVFEEGHSAILAGDFNDVPERAPLVEAKQAGYCDLYALFHPNERGLTWDNRNPFVQGHTVKLPDRRIDFLMIRETLLARYPPLSCELAFNRPNRRGIYPSDHYGVFAEIEF